MNNELIELKKYVKFLERVRKTHHFIFHSKKHRIKKKNVKKWDKLKKEFNNYF